VAGPTGTFRFSHSRPAVVWLLGPDRDALSIFTFSASSGVAPCSFPLKRLKLSFPWLSVESGISLYVLFLALT